MPNCFKILFGRLLMIQIKGYLSYLSLTMALLIENFERPLEERDRYGVHFNSVWLFGTSQNDSCT